MEEMVLDTKEEFNRIIDFVTREALTWELHSVEVEFFRRLLKMALVLLMLFLRSVGTGHIGPTLTTENGSVLRYRRTSSRKYLAIFGEVEIQRAYYLKDGGRGTSSGTNRPRGPWTGPTGLDCSKRPGRRNSSSMSE